MRASTSVFRTPAADVAERIAAQYHQTPECIVLDPADWVGSEDVDDFLRVSAELTAAAEESNLIIG